MTKCLNSTDRLPLWKWTAAWQIFLPNTVYFHLFTLYLGGVFRYFRQIWTSFWLLHCFYQMCFLWIVCSINFMFFQWKVFHSLEKCNILFVRFCNKVLLFVFVTRFWDMKLIVCLTDLVLRHVIDFVGLSLRQVIVCLYVCHYIETCDCLLVCLTLYWDKWLFVCVCDCLFECLTLF